MLEDLRRRLKRMAEIVAEEAERNPEFADQLLQVLEVIPSSEKPKKRVRKVLALDPFETYKQQGDEKFQSWLNGLSLQELRAIVRQQRFDPSRLSDKWKTKERFVQLIVERVESRSKQGDSFRFYGKESGNSTDKTVSG